ncbi:MAG TPA: hypothetical protein PKM72_08830, partial [Nitrospirales bacterium]|nr:hypothetical protein [Nitrospirales bacterium]
NDAHGVVQIGQTHFIFNGNLRQTWFNRHTSLLERDHRTSCSAHSRDLVRPIAPCTQDHAKDSTFGSTER